CRLRTGNPRAIYIDVRRARLRCTTRHRGDRPEPMGTRLSCTEPRHVMRHGYPCFPPRHGQAIVRPNRLRALGAPGEHEPGTRHARGAAWGARGFVDYVMRSCIERSRINHMASNRHSLVKKHETSSMKAWF